VTKSVASRVLNDDPTLTVRPETRERVWAAARELGYRPHAGARALAGAQARALALLIPDLGNPVYSRIIRGAYRRAREHGYVVLLAEDTADQQADETFAELVEAGRVDGLLIASARPAHTLLSSPRLQPIPHVFVNREVPGSGRNVGMDMPAASATAVRHLHALGHRAIGHVSGPEQLEPARARERGFLAAMHALGLETAPVERDDFDEQGGAAAATRLLTRCPDLTAVYTSTLSQAVGATHAVRGVGRRIPDDLSVISYDDLPLADYLDPPLTTVAMPLQELGAAAVDALVEQLGGRPPRDTTIPTTPLVISRRSTGPPPGGGSAEQAGSAPGGTVAARSAR
jgi:LacI family transcriptional regulator